MIYTISISMPDKARVKIYIDGANMLYAQKKMGWNIDWNKLVDYLKEQWDVLEIRYYTGVKEDDEKMKKFLKYLNHLGVVTVTKSLKVIKITLDHPLYRIHNYRELHKSNFDVEMTTDILVELLEGKDNPDHVKQLVLFSGDSDFNYLLGQLRKFGIGTIIFSSKKMLAWELKLAASKLVRLEDIQKVIERPKDSVPHPASSVKS